MSAATIDIRPVTPTIGAEVIGVDLGRELSNSQFDAVHQALLDHQVLFFRDQEMSLDAHEAFGRRFGTLHRHPDPTFPIEGHPDVIAVKADENSPRIIGGAWHSDTSCEIEPPMGAVLQVLEVPVGGGGDTLWASMYAAYDALSDSMKDFLGGLTAEHDSDAHYRAKRPPAPGTEYPHAVHPVVRTHPETGRKSLYVNRYYTTRINELNADESDALLAMLIAHAEKPEWQIRFKWQPKSVAFWDNRCTQHLALWDYYPERRFGYRVTVCGDKPF